MNYPARPKIRFGDGLPLHFQRLSSFSKFDIVFKYGNGYQLNTIVNDLKIYVLPVYSFYLPIECF